MPLRGILCYQTPGAGIGFRIRAPSWNRAVAARGLSRISPPAQVLPIRQKLRQRNEARRRSTLFDIDVNVDVHGDKSHLIQQYGKL